MEEKKPKETHIICVQEKKIAEMHKTIQMMEPIVLGQNGAPGLNVTVPILADNVANLTKNVNALTVSVTNLLEFQGREEARKENIEKIRQRSIQKNESRNRRMTLILSSVMVLTMIVSLIIALKK